MIDPPGGKRNSFILSFDKNEPVARPRQYTGVSTGVSMGTYKKRIGNVVGLEIRK